MAKSLTARNGFEEKNKPVVDQKYAKNILKLFLIFEKT